MRNKYTKDYLESIITKCSNWAQVCRKLDIKPATGAQSHVKKRAMDFKIDFSHFLGQASNRGKTFGPKRALNKFLVEDGPFISSHKLKLRLWKEGLKPKNCEQCFINEWLGEELVLELDHRNGNHFDNRLENLQILCPNCHAVKTRRARSPAVGGECLRSITGLVRIHPGAPFKAN